MSKKKEIPQEFFNIIKDFCNDILRTFPEYKNNLDKGLEDILENNFTSQEAENVFDYCKAIYPSEFFNILYQNEDIFTKNKPANLLPKISFYEIWNEKISDKTKTIIWKYLQLILFTIVNLQKKGDDFFGETSKLFEAIDEETFKKKIEESINQISEMFDYKDIDENNFNQKDLPNPEDLHEHISDLLGGNLGKLAKEIAEETVNELNIDTDNASTVGDIFKNLFKNPGKLMDLVKKVGNKLDKKIKKGEIKESELMQEASELMSKMKSMPGMKNIQSLLSSMVLSTNGKGKMNLSAMQNKLGMNIRQSKMKERMREKLKQRKKEKVKQPLEKIEKTPITKKKKKRKKKKKNKNKK